MAGGGLNVYGELWRAQLEQIADPSPSIKSRIYWSTTSSRPKIDTGSLLSAFLLNDQNMVMGTNATASNNLRWNRSAAATLELLIGSDATAEGSSTPANWAKLNTKLGGSKIDTYLDFTEQTTPSNPAASTRRAYFKSDGKLYSLDSAGVETAVASGSTILNTTSKTANFTLTGSNDYVEGDATAGSFALTLPSAVINQGKVFYLKKSDATANLVTVTATIDGATNCVLANKNEYIAVVANGTEWKTIAIRKAPTVQSFLSGSGTYTPAAGAKWLQVRMVGGGGGGGGTGAGFGNGGAGGNTTFAALLVANGGTGGGAIGGDPGTGGTASIAAGAVGLALSGGRGGGASPAIPTASVCGPMGAGTPFGGGGGATGGTGAGQAPSANTGGGGAGAYAGAGSNSGAGGGSGGYVDAIVSTMSATFAYAVGAAGTAGTGAIVGGAGAAGAIFITEFY